MGTPVQLLLRQINKVSHTFSAARIPSMTVFSILSWHRTCSMKLWVPVPWWRATGRGGQRWSLIWCRQWGRCWSNWAHRHYSLLQTIFIPGLSTNSLQCSHWYSVFLLGSSLVAAPALSLSAVARPLASLVWGPGTAPTSNFVIIKYSHSNPLEGVFRML